MGAAYLLANLGGNKDPTKEDIEAILESVGIEVDNDKLEKVISELSGKNIAEVIEEGRTKLATIPTGGAVASSGAGGSGAAADEGAKEEKKEEAKKEESEESDDDMGFGLFD